MTSKQKVESAFKKSMEDFSHNMGDYYKKKNLHN